MQNDYTGVFSIHLPLPARARSASPARAKFATKSVLASRCGATKSALRKRSADPIRPPGCYWCGATRRNCADVVAQTSKSVVSRVSKPAARSSSRALPIWKSAIQQVRRGGFVRWRIKKPALRHSGTTNAQSLAIVAIEIFDAGAGIENDYPFARGDFPGTLKQFQSCETGGGFRTHEEAFLRSHFAHCADHFFVINSDRAAVGLMKKLQDQKIANRFWNAQAGGDRVRVSKFCGGFFSGFEGADDWRATGGLHREHARTLFADPAERFHFSEGLPHSDETGAAARRI